MLFRVLADAVVVLHLAFILFVVLGGLLVLRGPRVVWIHLPAATWGAAVELFGWICPLTPLENALRRAGDAGAYGGGFVERYVVPVVYPAELTRDIQVVLGLAVVGVNTAIYAYAWRRASWRTSRS